MSKTFIPAITLAILSFSLFSCEEKGPYIDFGANKAVDTTYTAPVETPQARKVLIEEFTGVTCPNCPNGHQILAGIEAAHPGRTIIIGMHDNVSPQARPTHISSQDFRTQIATDIAQNVFGGSGNLPNAAIDRVRQNVNGNMVYLVEERNMWPGMVAARINVPSPVNISMTSNYDDAGRQATIRVRAAFTQAVQKKMALTVVLVENNIIDPQENGVNVDTFYNHKHVLRDVLTPATGAAILTQFDTKDAGRVYERSFTYTLNPKWKADNCKLVAYISYSEPGDKEVAQAAEIELK